MKKTIIHILTILLFLSTKINAQITLEHVIDSTGVPYFYCTYIDSNESKYVLLNTKQNSFSLFNMDMSPYLLNIHVPVISDSIIQGFGVIYITKSLFDCDSTNIEYVFENSYDVYHKFRVFRTDGTLLFEVDSANAPWGIGGLLGGSIDFKPIQNTSNGTKLFLQKYHGNQVPQILVYSLCGELPENVFDFSSQKEYLRIFPNPSSMKLTFEFFPPNNMEDFQLIIFDVSGKEQKRVNLTLSNNIYNLDISNMSSGTYLYSLISKTNTYQQGKFIISK